MAEEPQSQAARYPTNDEMRAAFEEYSAVVGKVAHAWNYLHEKLGLLFVVVSGAEKGIALSIWYSTGNDRAQRDMLRASISASAADRWPTCPHAKNDMEWILGTAEKFADLRNNAIHAPAGMYINPMDADSVEMRSAFWNGHPRAKRLMGKSLLDEYEWGEAVIEQLSRFTEKVETGLRWPERYTWPDRPSLPTRRQRKVRPGQPHQPPKERHQSQPQSSRV
jgi:hypothetical protein